MIVKGLVPQKSVNQLSVTEEPHVQAVGNVSAGEGETLQSL